MTAIVDQPRPAMLLRRARPARIPGPRAARPLVRLSCASGPPAPAICWVEGLRPRHWLIEAELLGYSDAEVVAEAEEVGYGDAELVADAEEVALAEVVVPEVVVPEIVVPTEIVVPAMAESSTGTPPIAVAKAAAPIVQAIRPASATKPANEPARAVAELEEQLPPWLLIGLVASVLAIVVTAAVIVQASAGHPGRVSVAPIPVASHSSAPTAASTVQAASAVAWLVQALDGHSNLVADAPTRAALLAQGVSVNTVFAAAQPLPATTNFVVSTAQLRNIAATGQDPAVARLLAESQPVAQFGTGADSVQVREVIPTGIRPSVVAASRTMAGQALLSNKSLSVVPEAVPLLSQGRLDLRAETLIAALAAQTRVRLIGLSQQPVEATAGAPIRTVQLDLGGSSRLLKEYIDALPVDYRPASSQRQRDGSYVVQWHPDLATAPPVS
jgi:hypothetical protein